MNQRKCVKQQEKKEQREILGELLVHCVKKTMRVLPNLNSMKSQWKMARSLDPEVEETLSAAAELVLACEDIHR